MSVGGYGDDVRPLPPPQYGPTIPDSLKHHKDQIYGHPLCYPRFEKCSWPPLSPRLRLSASSHLPASVTATPARPNLNDDIAAFA
ncbi:homeobox protein meis3-like protein [Lates japonicus]|uniref:Homeobox protein meis3-like protein n=1 Tax=Lates japonicus TaxID=270547 RepID=A0AAD3RF62_LATJO|nr:homeobox protein meis3-like protein [Lates japonicus]